MIPFEELYRQNSSPVLSYMLDFLKVQEVEKHITVREYIICALKEKLMMSQNHIKKQADQGYFECQFAEGNHVFL
jgi:hypothetical protein